MPRLPGPGGGREGPRPRQAAAAAEPRPRRRRPRPRKAAAAPEAGQGGLSRSRLPAATIRALKELEAGELNALRPDEDDLFRKLGIKLGQE